MRYNFILCSLTSVIFSLFLFVVTSFGADYPSNNPPFPPSELPADNLSYYFGSALSSDGHSFYGNFISYDRTPTYKGVFLRPRSSSSSGYDLITCACFPYDTNLTWSTCKYTNTNSAVNWRTTIEHFYGLSSYSMGEHSFYDSSNTRWIVYWDSVQIPLSLVNIENGVLNNTIYGDYIQVIDSSVDTASEFYGLCESYFVPIPEGSFNDSIPSFVDSYSYYWEGQLPISSSGLEMITYYATNIDFSPSLSDGSTYDSSIYVIDYALRFTIGGYREVDSVAESYQLATTQSFQELSLANTDTHFVLNNMFHDISMDPIYHFMGVGFDKYAWQDVYVSARLRRRSDGAFGHWYTVRADKLPTSESSFYTGLTSGIEDSVNSAFSEIDSALSSAVDTVSSFVKDDVAMGTAKNNNRIYEGGGLGFEPVDVSSLTGVVRQVPSLFAVIFSFLPPEVLLFISTAFVTMIALAIVKAIL